MKDRLKKWMRLGLLVLLLGGVSLTTMDCASSKKGGDTTDNRSGDRDNNGD